MLIFPWRSILGHAIIYVKGGTFYLLATKHFINEPIKKKHFINESIIQGKGYSVKGA